MSLPPLPPAPGRMIPHWCTDEIDAIEAYGSLCRKKALEDAAEACNNEQWVLGNRNVNFVVAYNEGCDDCAKAIGRLI